MQERMLKQSELAENIANAMIAQNEAILYCFLHPDECKPKPGYSQDAYGNQVYVDSDGIPHSITTTYDLNGWTV